jgi:hypothetical protein
MILSKLGEAIGEQKWPSVILEVLIVVLGIFIGLQVDGWNDDRKDRIEEQIILERLATEISIAIEDVQNDIDQLENRIGDIAYVIAMLEEENAPKTGDARFINGIIGAARIELPFSGLATIRELQNTGKITLILNGEVRAAISALEDTYRKAESYTGFVTVRLVPLSAVVDSYVRRIGSDWDGTMSLEYDFAELAAAREFRFALGNLGSFLIDNKGWMQQHLSSLEDLQSTLAATRDNATK